MCALDDESAAGSFDPDSNLPEPKKKPPLRVAFSLAKDCDFNIFGAIVVFYSLFEFLAFKTSTRTLML